MEPVTTQQTIPLKQAKHWRWAAPGRVVDLIVIHSAETSERPHTAEGLGAYFQDPKQIRNGVLTPVSASAHYSVDSDTIVCSVPPEHIASHVRAKGQNARSVGIELAGRAKQTRDEWLDEYGRRMLPLAAWLVATLCRRFGVPMVWLTPDQIRAGERGLCGHRDIRDAYREDDHYDPGEHFPKDVFVDLVEQSAGSLAVQSTHDTDPAPELSPDSQPTLTETPIAKTKSGEMRAVKP